jgi:hypothetical protein
MDETLSDKRNEDLADRYQKFLDMIFDLGVDHKKTWDIVEHVRKMTHAYLDHGLEIGKEIYGRPLIGS